MGCMVRIGCLVFVVGRVYLLGHEETGESGIISVYGSKAVYRESFGAFVGGAGKLMPLLLAFIMLSILDNWQRRFLSVSRSRIYHCMAACLLPLIGWEAMSSCVMVNQKVRKHSCQTTGGDFCARSCLLVLLFLLMIRFM